MRDRPRSVLAGVAVAVAALVVAGYFVLGMPGMDHGGSTSMLGMNHGSADGARPLPPAEFAARLAEGAFVVDVQVPSGRQLAGADATIPYDEIVGHPSLPASRATPILLYCRTGRTSATAGRALLAAGYRDVAHLDGGTRAWERAGYELTTAK